MSVGWRGEKHRAAFAAGVKAAGLGGGAAARPEKFEKVWTLIHMFDAHWPDSQAMLEQIRFWKSERAVAALVWNSPVRIRREASSVALSRVAPTRNTRASSTRPKVISIRGRLIRPN